MILTATVVFLGGTAWTIFFYRSPTVKWVGLSKRLEYETMDSSIENLAIYGVAC